jgi:hypothetical protein
LPLLSGVGADPQELTGAELLNPATGSGFKKAAAEKQREILEVMKYFCHT